jgi:alkylation response protein AidB-like acyl-CoA dehydrogenase
MIKWHVILLAALAVLFLLTGLLALILPEDYEGQEIYRIDRMHAIRLLDLVGGLLLIVGCVVAWTAGVIWQRGTDAS